MAFFGCLVEGIGRTGSYPLRRIWRNAQRSSDLVGGEETDAKDILRKLVWISLDDGNGIIMILFVDLGGQACAHTVALQEEHDLFDCTLFGPGSDNHLRAFAPDPRHLAQAFGRMVDDIQGL